MRFLAPLFLSLLAVLPARAAGDLDLTPVKRWIARQDEVRSVQADFTQTRSFRALKSPVAIPGRLWFSTAPRAFRWEMGDPAKTIILRQADAGLFIQPAKKRAERFDPASVAAGGKKSGAHAFAMMNFPLAKDFADFNRQFEVLAVNASNPARCHVEVLPRDPAARKFLEVVKLDFEPATGHLLAFEIALRDGSSLRNEFTNVRLNQKIDRRVFDYDLTGYEVVNAAE